MYKAMMDNMFDHLDRFAEDMAKYEPEPVTVQPPQRPGYAPEPVAVIAVYDPNPTPYLLKTVGIEANLNGLLYIRTAHIPVVNGIPLLDFHPMGDGIADTGWHVYLRGRKFRVTKIDADRREVLMVLSDVASMVRSQ